LDITLPNSEELEAGDDSNAWLQASGEKKELLNADFFGGKGAGE